MKKNFITILFILSICQFSFGQDKDSTKKTPVFTISGGVDGYYRYNFNTPKETPYNNFTSFTRSINSFELGMASLRVDHSFGKVAATIDLGFGTRAEEFAYNDANTRFAIKQLYLSYAPSSAIKFTLGTWGTHVGYEMVDPWLNRSYSMSYMFTNGPFTHTGLKAEISLGGKTSFMVGVSNPTDLRTGPAMPKTVIAQLSSATKDEKLRAFINFTGGKQNDYKKVVQGDIVLSYAPSAKFSLTINATLQSLEIDTDSTGQFSSSKWFGTALYLNYDPVKWFGLSLRTEYIGDDNQYLGLKNVIATTLSANFRIDNLMIIPEFRFDDAKNSVFYKNGSQITSSSGSFILAVVYHFRINTL